MKRYLRNLEKIFGVRRRKLRAMRPTDPYYRKCYAYWDGANIVVRLRSLATGKLYSFSHLCSAVSHEFAHTLGPWYHTAKFRRILKYVRRKANET